LALTGRGFLNILYAAAEVAPYSKVGGLADVAASLPKALRSLGHDVRVLAPAHSPLPAEAVVARAAIPVLGVEETAAYFQPEEQVYLAANPNYFGEKAVYGEPDDLHRYYFFSLAVLQAPQALRWRPDVIHCNDWHTGWVPLGLRNYAMNDTRYRGIASALTIHNLAYRGPDAVSDILGPAIYYADAVNTVRPTYAREITSPEYGLGLEALIGLRGSSLRGILNGIDLEIYDPARDPALAANYRPESLDRRAENKAALQDRIGLAVEPGTPLAGVVSRLDAQKGLDLLIPVIDQLVNQLGLQLVVLGSGARPYEEALSEATQRHPGRVQAVFAFRPDLAPLIYAGADLFVMPSRFEPCGLGQLIAMRYGAIPVVRRTGGLADTVQDVAADLAKGTGFVFQDYQPQDLFDALQRAVLAYNEEPPCSPGSWQRLVRGVMAQDHSWAAPARRYEEMYIDALRAMREA